MPGSRVDYQIDGSKINRTEDFYRVIGAAINGPGGYFGTGLDAFIDCLRGGFGTPDDHNYGFVITASDHVRSALGYDETVRQLTLRLARCHPASRELVQRDLDLAQRRSGPTVFDWLTDIMQAGDVRFELR